MQQYRSQQGDTLSAIAFKHYGQRMGSTEQLLEANPHLAGAGAILPLHSLVNIPELATAQPTKSTIQLWD